jgi:hypothetical protein
VDDQRAAVLPGAAVFVDVAEQVKRRGERGDARAQISAAGAAVADAIADAGGRAVGDEDVDAGGTSPSGMTSSS